MLVACLVMLILIVLLVERSYMVVFHFHYLTMLRGLVTPKRDVNEANCCDEGQSYLPIGSYDLDCDRDKETHDILGGDLLDNCSPH